MLAAVGVDDLLGGAEVLAHLLDLIAHLRVLGASFLGASFYRCLQLLNAGINTSNSLLDFGSLLLGELPALADSQLIGDFQKGLDLVQLVPLLGYLLIQGRDLDARADTAVLYHRVHGRQLLVQGVDLALECGLDAAQLVLVLLFRT